MMSDYYRFPSDFLWGCATASFQVEGAASEDGRGPSIWDTFCRTPGRVKMDHNGDVAVDQYHRYKDDVQLMKRLGVKAYRFSVAWPRVLPSGDGPVNEKGLAYYDRLVDELLANGIEPWMTLYHWDLPQALQDRWGGWQSADTARAFADYAAIVSRRLTDRVSRIFTINEFVCFADHSHAIGEHAPGLCLGPCERNQVRHHALLAHGLGVQAVRANARGPLQVGLAENATVCVPVIETPEHVEAARRAMRRINAPFLTAVMEGAYPAEYLQDEGANAPVFREAEMRAIGSPLDFVGLNMYAPTYIRAAPETPAGFVAVPHPASYPRMVPHWLFVGPQITYWGPRLVSDLWRPKAIYITENGCACEDRPAADGEIYDTDRVMYLRNHLVSLHRGVAEGLPVKGYFLWSLLDNFEWAEGYTQRFGITYVNYSTLERTPKLSAKYYREVMARGAVV
jgi:beta-glucosidase